MATSDGINRFNETTPACGPSFIGREAILADWMENWRLTGGHYARSLIGLNRMGKTSLAAEFCRRVKASDPDVICVRLSLNQSSWPELIRRMIQAVQDESLLEQRELHPAIRKVCDELLAMRIDAAVPLSEQDVNGKFALLQQVCGKLGQRILFVIDEFDGAKVAWKDKACYFENLRDAAQREGYFLLVSRRPLEMIEKDSYGNSCFHNVFRETSLKAFDGKDMQAYYAFLSDHYGIVPDAGERERIEEITGCCPTFLAAVGYRLAAAALTGRPVPSVEEIYASAELRSNFRTHYKEFLTRMQEDGLWNDVVCFIMDIPREFSEDDRLCLENRGYIRKKNDDAYVSVSDDFTAWVRRRLCGREIDTVYQNVIRAEVAIREMLREEMPVIWGRLHPGVNWQKDFENNGASVPQSVRGFVSKSLPLYLRNARSEEPNAEAVDALPIKTKLTLVREFWSDGISVRFGSQPYSEWQACFDTFEEKRNPLFHAQITPDDKSARHYQSLKQMNEAADRILRQLSTGTQPA